MSCIPIVWQHHAQAPPEWVLLEMQGELQFKEGRLKKGTGSGGSGLSAFEGMEMGVLAPHAEHGPTRPELRIGNLVIQGKLVPLSKPLLVLTTRRLGAEADVVAHPESNGTGSALSSPVSDSTKRKRESAAAASSDSKKAARVDLADTSAASVSAAATAASSAAGSAPSSLPSSCLQTVAVIRHKYLFTSRPYAICDMGAAAVPSAATLAHAATAATAKSAKAH